MLICLIAQLWWVPDQYTYLLYFLNTCVMLLYWRLVPAWCFLYPWTMCFSDLHSAGLGFAVGSSLLSTPDSLLGSKLKGDVGSVHWQLSAFRGAGSRLRCRLPSCILGTAFTQPGPKHAYSCSTVTWNPQLAWEQVR